MQLTDVIFAHSGHREEEHLSVQTPADPHKHTSESCSDSPEHHLSSHHSSPLYPRSARLLSNRIQEERDGLVYLIHADPAQHFLQEVEVEGMVVMPPAVVAHGDAT